MEAQTSLNRPNIVIGALGTTNYKQTTYTFGDNSPSYPTQFFLAALAAVKQAQHILVFATEAAQNNNGQLLEDEAQRLCGIKPTFIRIDEGKDMYELWDIFQAIANAIPQNAEVFADITNSYRSLPLLMNSALVYLTHVKGVTVREIAYGAFEAKSADNISPVFNITPFTSLIDWSAAVKVFTTTGSCSAISDMLDTTLVYIVDSKYFVLEEDGWERLPQEIDEHFAKLQSLLQQFSEFADMIYIIRLTNIAKDIVEEIKAVREYLIAPIATFFDSIQQEFNRFAAPPFTLSTAQEQLAKQIRLMEWLTDKKHYFQAITVAREWFITWAMLQHGGFQEDDFLNFEKRDDINVPDVIRKRPYSNQQETIRIWNSTKELRNELAHCGYSKTTKSAEDIQKKVEKIVQFLAKKGPSL